MGVQNWCHNNYRWGAFASEDLLPGDSKNCSIIPAKTSLPSSSSIHRGDFYSSWLYHVDEHGTQTVAAEFIQEFPLFPTDCTGPDPRGPLPAAMVWRPLQAALKPLVTSQVSDPMSQPTPSCDARDGLWSNHLLD